MGMHLFPQRALIDSIRIVNAFAADHFEVCRIAEGLVKILTSWTDNGLRHFTRLGQGMLEGFGDTVEDVPL